MRKCHGAHIAIIIVTCCSLRSRTISTILILLFTLSKVKQGTGSHSPSWETSGWKKIQHNDNTLWSPLRSSIMTPLPPMNSNVLCHQAEWEVRWWSVSLWGLRTCHHSKWWLKLQTQHLQSFPISSQIHLKQELTQNSITCSGNWSHDCVACQPNFLTTSFKSCVVCTTVYTSFFIDWLVIRLLDRK